MTRPIHPFCATFFFLPSNISSSIPPQYLGIHFFPSLHLASFFSSKQFLCWHYRNNNLWKLLPYAISQITDQLHMLIWHCSVVRCPPCGAFPFISKAKKHWIIKSTVLHLTVPKELRFSILRPFYFTDASDTHIDSFIS